MHLCRVDSPVIYSHELTKQQTNQWKSIVKDRYKITGLGEHTHPNLKNIFSFLLPIIKSYYFFLLIPELYGKIQVGNFYANFIISLSSQDSARCNNYDKSLYLTF